MFDTREKRERSLGAKLFLKSERCNSPKCVMVRRPTRPGVHGAGKKFQRISEYGTQLKEKQKVKYSYGLREKTFRRIILEAIKSPGVTGEVILTLLERRLDNVIYRMGFAPSRAIARQLVSHGHFIINNRKVTIPSYQMKVGDKVRVRPQSEKHPSFKELQRDITKLDLPNWVSRTQDKLEGEMMALPRDIDMPFDINMVVDYYSKILK
jgi:small subunit ribosomal protein S4